MSNTPSLLPCPFCGGAATAKPIDSAPGWYHFIVLHSGCFYKPAMDQMLLNDESLEAWNRRTPQPVVREPLTVQEVEQLLAQWSYELHGDRARYLVRMTERAHGITQKGGSNAE